MSDTVNEPDAFWHPGEPDEWKPGMLILMRREPLPSQVALGVGEFYIEVLGDCTMVTNWNHPSLWPGRKSDRPVDLPGVIGGYETEDCPYQLANPEGQYPHQREGIIAWHPGISATLEWMNNADH